MSTRLELVARRRDVLGKKVARLRRAGQLPAVLYGHGHASEPLQVDARDFELVRRRGGRNQLVDLRVEEGTAQPVFIHGIQEHPVTRRPLHIDFFAVKMTEEITVDVPVAMVGESHAIEKLGGTLLHLLDTVRVRVLPANVPQALELDITPLDTFELLLHVRDLQIPEGVTLLTEGDEPLARVQAPRIEEEEPVAEEAEEEEAEGEGAEGEAPSAEAGEPAAE